jgi:hypothetical protein
MSNVNVMIVMEEPVTFDHITPIIQYMKILGVQQDQFSGESSATDALALQSLDQKFRIIRNLPEQTGFSLYAEEDFVNNDAFSMTSSIHG